MKKFFEKILPLSILFLFKNLRNKLFANLIISNWEIKGKPLPPPHQVKQKTISYYHNKFKYDILVETGTFWGDMISAQKKQFRKIYSIELSNYFYKVAKKDLESEC